MSARRWVPPLLWAAVILVLTSIPGAQLPSTNVHDADKLVHLTMYGVLGWLCARAIWTRERVTRSLLLLLAAVSLFGAVDEWHQQFIPGRSMELLDWMSDTAGAGAGLLAMALARREARS